MVNNTWHAIIISFTVLDICVCNIQKMKTEIHLVDLNLQEGDKNELWHDIVWFGKVRSKTVTFS